MNGRVATVQTQWRLKKWERFTLLREKLETPKRNKEEGQYFSMSWLAHSRSQAGTYVGKLNAVRLRKRGSMQGENP